MSIKVTGSSPDKSKKGAPAAAAQAKGSSGVAVDRVREAGASFMDVVEDMESRQIIEELDEIGAQLTRYPTTALVRRYRELVGLALDKVKNGMHIRREFKWRRTERSMFITFERAEGLREDLEDALSRTGDRAKVLSLVDEIKGCLISLLF
jgi:uncharacterized protein YaaR (DUF327 family)